MTFQREYFFFKVCTINILFLSQKINQFHFNCHALVQLKDSLKGNSRENHPCFLSSLWFPNGM